MQRAEEEEEEEGHLLEEIARKALVISVSDYNSKGLQPLDFCKKDGEEMYQLLKSLGYQITDNHKLVGQVNYEKMRDAIIDFFTDVNTKSEDILLFYFSGHGIPDTLGDMYLTSSDIDSDAPFRRGFSFGDLTEMIQRSTSTRIVIILDCCYSGSAKLSLGSEDAATVFGTAAIRDKTRFLKESEGKYLLAASQAAQEAYALAEGDHSIFTYYLLKGLKGSKRAVDAEGNVTPLSLGTYIFRQIVNLPPERKPKQKPIVKVEASGDIVLAQYPKSTAVKKPKGEGEAAAAKTEQEEGVSNVIQPTTTATPESSLPEVQLPPPKLASELTASTTTKDTAPVVQDAREKEAVAAASPPDLEKPTQEIQQEQPSPPSVLPSETASSSIEEETVRSSSEVAISPSSSAPAKPPLPSVDSPLSSLTTTKKDDGTGIAAALHEQETKEAKSIQTEPSQGMPQPSDQRHDNGIVEERKGPPQGSKSWKWIAIAGGAVGVILISMLVIGNSPPRAIDDPSITTSTNEPVAVKLSGADEDNDDLTTATVSNPLHGTLSEINQNTGVVTYTPNPGFVGTDEFTFKVNDGTVDSSNVGTVRIQVNQQEPKHPNNAPVPIDRSDATTMNTPIDITLAATDQDKNDNLTAEIVSPPSNGALSEINQNTGVVTYTPNPGFVGTDEFTFKVNDGTVDSSNVGTVRIQVS